jgi:hypothetical protein
VNQEELARLHREAEEELGRYPGVVGVAYGEKRRGGEPTGEVGFCVYVQEKKPLDQLTPEETLPTEYKGIPVDVDEVPDATRIAECQDRDIHSPLIGGITISNLNPVPTGDYELGTLGCFATLNGVDPPDNVVALTNHHVTMAQGAAVGDPIYQPRKVPLPTGQLAVDLSNRNQIGKIERAGAEQNVRFAYPNEAQDDYYVDCAAVRINISISSWCDTNCGESIRNEIRGLNVLGANAIVDVARVVQADIPPPTSAPYKVVKVGSRTSRTEARVSRLNVPMLHGEKNVIEITAMANNCEGNLMFADHGDSGSALINAQAKLIGLVFGVDTATPSLAYACHIHPVLDQLNVTAITNQHPPDSRVTRSDTDLVVDGRRSHAHELREKLLGSNEGRRIAAIVEEHRYEVVRLVNTNRRVTIAWRRNHGPAFLNRAIANARDPAVAIPREIEAVSRETLLHAMDRALTEHGSAALRAVLDEHRDEVLAHVDAFDSLHDIVDLLAERELA